MEVAVVLCKSIGCVSKRDRADRELGGKKINST